MLVMICSCAFNGVSDGNIQLMGAELNNMNASFAVVTRWQRDLDDEITIFFFRRGSDMEIKWRCSPYLPGFKVFFLLIKHDDRSVSETFVYHLQTLINWLIDQASHARTYGEVFQGLAIIVRQVYWVISEGSLKCFFGNHPDTHTCSVLVT